jgi:hypothetical protein
LGEITFIARSDEGAHLCALPSEIKKVTGEMAGVSEAFTGWGKKNVIAQASDSTARSTADRTKLTLLTRAAATGESCASETLNDDLAAHTSW